MKELIITPLGTISPYCKNDMNCPSFLIEYDDNKLLLDCGNGITRMLKLPNDLNNLNIFITHYHKDHYGDLGILQYASYVYHKLGTINTPIKIYLPEKDFCFSKQSILSNHESYSEYNYISNNVKYIISDIQISFYNNNSHTIESFMIKLENEQFKIIYTSDVGTTNINDLVNFCSYADLIICESSFLLKHKSNSLTHLTAYDAGKIAKLSNAKKLLLTHFWPEEDKDLYLAEAKALFENTEAAEEGKKIILRRI